MRVALKRYQAKGALKRIRHQLKSIERFKNLLNDTNWDRICVTFLSNVARNDASGSTFWAFFFWGLLLRDSGLKVVRSAVRTLARNVPRNDARNACPTAILQYTFNTTLISLRKCEDSSYVTLHDTESGHHEPREATREDLRVL